MKNKKSKILIEKMFPSKYAQKYHDSDEMSRKITDAVIKKNPEEDFDLSILAKIIREVIEDYKNEQIISSVREKIIKRNPKEKLDLKVVDKIIRKELKKQNKQ